MTSRITLSRALLSLLPPLLCGALGSSAFASPQGDTKAAEDAGANAGADSASDADETKDDTQAQDHWTHVNEEMRGLRILDVGYSPRALIWGYGRATMFHNKAGDAQGVSMDYARINLTGALKFANYRVTADAASGKLVLQDAWLSSHLSEEVSFTIGQFKTPFLRSGLVEARDLLFLVRTRNGVFYSRRDRGVMLSGGHGRFNWSFALQNGYVDEMTDDRTLTTFQTSIDVIGSEALSWEGAYGSESKTRLAVGSSFSQDHTKSNGAAVAVEANLVHKRLSLQGEYLHYGSAYSHPGLLPADLAEQRGSTSPFSITTSYMLVPRKYELALRYEDFDDRRSPFNYQRRNVTFGINRYIEGHDIKWQFNVAYAHKGGSSSALVHDGPHDMTYGLGLTASF